jgi:hypothetical protein
MATVPAGLADAPQDRYYLDRELGQGGMATAYLAHDLGFDPGARFRFCLTVSRAPSRNSGGGSW